MRLAAYDKKPRDWYCYRPSRVPPRIPPPFSITGAWGLHIMQEGSLLPQHCRLPVAQHTLLAGYPCPLFQPGLKKIVAAIFHPIWLQNYHGSGPRGVSQKAPLRSKSGYGFPFRPRAVTVRPHRRSGRRCWSSTPSAGASTPTSSPSRCGIVPWRGFMGHRRIFRAASPAVRAAFHL